MNNPKNEELYEIENKYWVDMWHSLERLQENSDFKKVILEGYFKDKAVNGVSMLSKHGPGRNDRTDILEDLVSISNLQYFFMMIENFGCPPPEENEE